ncbi:MAG: PD-(D/E)XK nuclease family protein [Halanaerobiaceae bacterium]
MIENNLSDLYFSQLALDIYEKCPLKFRHRYLDGLFWPRDWAGNSEQRELIERGKRFHRLARRYYARGEVMAEGILSEELGTWFERLREFRSFNENDGFFPEHELRLNQDGMKLVAKFDLLYLDKRKRQFIIYDWKTNRKQFSDKVDYSSSMQSIVYQYVLFAAGDKYFPFAKLSPSDINLVYWNPRYPRNIKRIKYSRSKFNRDKEFLIDKITEIRNLNYDDFKAVNDENTCKYCEYRPICYGEKPELIEVEEDDLDLELDWEAVEEIQF